METEVSFTTANVDEFIEEQIQELCGTLKPMEETLGADTAQKQRMNSQTVCAGSCGRPYPQRKDVGCTAQGRAGTRHSRWADDRRRREGAAVRGGPMNSRGKMVERLMRDLEAAGAPVEVFNGKSGAEIMDELVKLLKMYSVSLEIAKEARDILHDLTRKDEKLS